MTAGDKKMEELERQNQQHLEVQALSEDLEDRLELATGVVDTLCVGNACGANGCAANNNGW